jgi:hypothetical protein
MNFKLSYNIRYSHVGSDRDEKLIHPESFSVDSTKFY